MPTSIGGHSSLTRHCRRKGRTANNICRKSSAATIREAGAAEGIPFDFEAIGVSPNTLDAHRLIRWASGAGDGVQDGLARRLFRLYFEEGAHIGNHNVPIEAARDAGMDAAVVESLLATDCDRLRP